MGNIPVRKPKQKRSIEKKTKIMKAGLELFREKGYYNSNTAEIAKKTDDSTGTVYSYFKDKKDIFLASSNYFLDIHFQVLLDDLVNTPKPINVNVFVNECIDWFINFCLSSKQIVNDRALMQEQAPEIMEYFNAYNDTLLSAFVAVLDSPGID